MIDDAPAGFARNDPSAMGDRIKGATAMTADLRERLAELVAALDATNWSSWQTTARFSPALEAARAALALPTAPAPEPAKQRFDAMWMEVDGDAPIDRLRFFCSLAMNGQDWLDVEPFFDALASPPHQTESERLQRLKDAIEGECDGLAITDAHARAILEYVEGGS